MQNPLAQLSPFDINVLGKEERRKYSRAPIKFSLFYSTPDGPGGSSALSRTDVGSSMPRVFAVLRLTTNSTLVGCCTGNSAGPGTFENLAGVNAGLTINVEVIHPVTH